MILTEQILDFLDKFGIEVSENEDPSMTELMMDDHKCFAFGGKEYYVHEDHSMATEDEEEIYDHLCDHYLA